MATREYPEYGLTVDTLTVVHEKLAEALGPDWVSNDPAILTCYFRDFTARVGKWPNLVAMPSSTEEVQAIMRIAQEYRIPVVPLSTGFNHGGTALPQWGGILVDLKRMDKVLAVDEEGMTITLQPYVGNARVYTKANCCSALEGLLLKPAVSFLRIRRHQRSRLRSHTGHPRGVRRFTHGLGREKAGKRYPVGVLLLRL